MTFEARPIGFVRSPYKSPSDAPPQGRMRDDIISEIEVLPEFEEGLKDVEGFSHLIVLCWHHRSRRDALTVVPPWDGRPHGVFATRSPNRPNPICLCVVRLLRREGNRLVVKWLDAIDGTPILDIKPYIPSIDAYPDAKSGWLEGTDAPRAFRGEG